MRPLRNEEIKKLHQIAADKGLVKLRACIYARKSREDKSNTSLPVQTEECKAFVSENNGLLSFEESDIFQEDNVSGMGLSPREEFDKMMAAVRNGDYDVVIVSKFDRLSRDIATTTSLVNEFEKLGVHLIAGDDMGDDSAAGMLNKQIYWATNEFHVRRSVEDLMKTHANLVRSGKTVGGPGNFGYKVENRKYVINPEEAIAVNMIFDMFLDGKSYTDIANILEWKNLKPRYSNRFSHSLIHSVLTNPRNYGRSVWNSKDKRKQRKRVLRQVMDEVESETVVEEAIITKDTFDKVQAIMKERTYGKHKGASRSYLLTGLIKCNACGGAMTGNSQRSGRNKTLYRTYHCKNHKKKHGATCSTKAIRLEYMETFIKQEVVKHLNASLKKQPLKKDAINAFVENDKSTLRRLNKEIEKKDKNLSNMVRGFYDITSDTVKSKTETEIEALNQEIEIAKEERNILTKRLNAIEQNRQAFNQGGITMDTLFQDADLSRQLIRSMVKEVKVDNHEIQIEFY